MYLLIIRALFKKILCANIQKNPEIKLISNHFLEHVSVLLQVALSSVIFTLVMWSYLRGSDSPYADIPNLVYACDCQENHKNHQLFKR